MTKNHTRQDAADRIILKQTVMDIINMDFPSDVLKRVMRYYSQTLRMFHPHRYGSLPLRDAQRRRNRIFDRRYSDGGNGVEFGIKIAGLGDEWVTAPATNASGPVYFE